MEQEKQESIASFWSNKSKKGEYYLKGKIRGTKCDVDVVCFENKKRKELKEAGDKDYLKQPLWICFKSEEPKSEKTFEDNLEQ